MRKKVIDGDQFVEASSNGNIIRMNLGRDDEEIVKISEMDDNEEIVITGKQLKELQKHWKTD